MSVTDRLIGIQTLNAFPRAGFKWAEALVMIIIRGPYPPSNAIIYMHCFLWRPLSCGGPWASAQFAPPLKSGLAVPVVQPATFIRGGGQSAMFHVDAPPSPCTCYTATCRCVIPKRKEYSISVSVYFAHRAGAPRHSEYHLFLLSYGLLQLNAIVIAQQHELESRPLD